MKMVHPTNTVNKLLRALQFRKHLKEITSACKRINQDSCYESVTQRHSNSTNKQTKFHRFRKKLSKARRNKTNSSAGVQSTCSCSKSSSPSILSVEHLARATATNPANLTAIVKQSYKPLHGKSSQFNQNTIAVSKDSSVKCLYARSNWVFVETEQTHQTGFVPIYCLDLPSTKETESFSQNNLSLLNVSVNEKSMDLTPEPSCGRFISSIGACQTHLEPIILANANLNKTKVQHLRLKDQSNLSRQISNVSLHAYDEDAYGTLNLTPCRNLSFSILDTEPMNNIDLNRRRLRVIENYQKQYVGDLSVLESEVVTRLDQTTLIDSHWRLVRRGDGRQGFIPKHIAVVDKHFK